MVAMMTSETLLDLLHQHRLWQLSNGRIGSRLSALDLDLRSIDPKEIYIAEAELPGAIAKDVDLHGKDLYAINLGGAQLQGTILRSANLGKALLDAADLTGADLSDASLLRTSLVDAILVGARLEQASLRKADATGADLRGARLDSADVEGLCLTGAWLEGASFVGLRGTDKLRADWIDIGRVRGQSVLRGADVLAWLNPTRTP